MYLISNKQHDDAVKFIEQYVASLDPKDTKTSERKRLATKLLKELKKKQPIENEKAGKAKRRSPAGHLPTMRPLAFTARAELRQTAIPLQMQG